MEGHRNPCNPGNPGNLVTILFWKIEEKIQPVGNPVTA